MSDSAVTVDKETVQEDEAKAKAKLEGLKDQAESKAGELKQEGTAKAAGDGGR